MSSYFQFPLFLFFAGLILSSQSTMAQKYPLCPDDSYFTVHGDDGVRYGWFEDATCQFKQVTPHPTCPDNSFFTVQGENGVSYGWYDNATCIVDIDGGQSSLPECPDSSYFTVTGANGIDYGWFDNQSCVIPSLEPEPDSMVGEPEVIDTEVTEPLVMEPEEATQSEEPKSLYPETGEFILFDGSNDPRLLRWREKEGYYVTLSGLKRPNGDPENISNVLIENGENEYISVNIDEDNRSLTMETSTAKYSLFINAHYEMVYRIDVDEQFVEYVLSDEVSVSVKQLSGELYNINQKRTVSALGDTPSAVIRATGCYESIESVSLKALKPYRDSDLNLQYKPLDQYRTFKTGDATYEAVPSGLGREQLIIDFSQKMVNFLENYAIPNFVDGARDVTDVTIDRLVDERITELTDRIDDLEDADDWFPTGVSDDFGDILDTSTKRVLWLGLRKILSTLNYITKATEIYDGSLAFTSGVILATNFSNDPGVVFEVVALTSSGVTIVGERSIAFDRDDLSSLEFTIDINCEGDIHLLRITVPITIDRTSGRDDFDIGEYESEHDIWACVVSSDEYFEFTGAPFRFLSYQYTQSGPNVLGYSSVGSSVREFDASSNTYSMSTNITQDPAENCVSFRGNRFDDIVATVELKNGAYMAAVNGTRIIKEGGCTSDYTIREKITAIENRQITMTNWSRRYGPSFCTGNIWEKHDKFIIGAR